MSTRISLFYLNTGRTFDDPNLHIYHEEVDGTYHFELNTQCACVNLTIDQKNAQKLATALHTMDETEGEG